MLTVPAKQQSRDCYRENISHVPSRSCQTTKYRQCYCENIGPFSVTVKTSGHSPRPCETPNTALLWKHRALLLLVPVKQQLTQRVTVKTSRTFERFSFMRILVTISSSILVIITVKNHLSPRSVPFRLPPRNLPWLNFVCSRYIIIDVVVVVTWLTVGMMSSFLTLFLAKNFTSHHDVIAYGHDVLMFNAQLSPKRVVAGTEREVGKRESMPNSTLSPPEWRLHLRREVLCEPFWCSINCESINHNFWREGNRSWIEPRPFCLPA